MKIARLFCAVGLLGLGGASYAQQAGYPAPRFPDFPINLTVADLMPAARAFVARERGGAVPGYAIKPGQKALLLITPLYDQRVVDAFTGAIREAGGTADVFTGDISDLIGTQSGIGEWGYLENPIYLDMENLGRVQLGGGLTADEIYRLMKVRNYDILLNGSSTVDSPPEFAWEEFPWHRPDELLSSAQTPMPKELSDKIYDLAWDQLRQAVRIRVTDPEGTDLSWNMPAAVAEIKGTPRFWREYMCMPDRLKGMAVQGEETFKEVDVNGVIAGTTNHIGAFPAIRVVVRHGQITNIEGGGRFGEEWRKVLQQYEHTQWPGGLPGPGFNWVEECAVGVVPAAVRPRDAMSFPNGTVRERRRTGIIHWAFGAQGGAEERSSLFAPNAARQSEKRLPDGHFDVHNMFPTMTLELKDGRKIVFIDKGHMTILDNPEVRALAAKFGNPDDLLREAWVPPVPGINVAGDYQKDYAKDPVTWIANEYERFFAHR